MIFFKKKLFVFLSGYAFIFAGAASASSCNIQNLNDYKIHSMQNINCIWKMYYHTRNIAYPVVLLKFINQSSETLSMVYEYENRLKIISMIGNAAKKLPYDMTAQGMGDGVKKSCPLFKGNAREIQTKIVTAYEAIQSIEHEAAQNPQLKRAIINLMQKKPMEYNYAHKIYCFGVAANKGNSNPKVQTAFCQTVFKRARNEEIKNCGSHEI